MGIFSKLKQNLQHGGVKVKVDAPATISLKDNFDVAITITSTDPQKIKSVTVSFVKHLVNTQNANEPTIRTVVTKREDTTFNIAAGETKQIKINMSLDPAKDPELNDLIKELDPSGITEGMAKIAGNLMKVTEALNNKQYDYYIEAKVDVDGIAFDPAGQVSVQFLRPGELGASARINL